MSTTTGSEAVAHADAFATDALTSGVACADLPMEQRLEVLLLTADRPLNDTKLIELLGLMPTLPGKVKRKPKPQRAPSDGSAEPTGETDADAEALDDPATAKARRHAVTILRQTIDQLNAAYESTGRTFRIDAIATGWQMLTLPTFGPLLGRLRGERQQSRLSQAALETLAIVAYRQPILRADLESIRGVACGEVLKSLMDRRLVRIVGRAEEVGRPMLYGTTKEFLRIFGIANLNDLPAGRELKT